MIERISQTFKHVDLKNGFLELDADVAIVGTVLISDPRIKFSLADMDIGRTTKLGKGCYKKLSIRESFDGEITVVYNTFDNTRTDIAEDRLQLKNDTLSYDKVVNKTTVVEDTHREQITFNQVSDADPLAARYLLLQQFSGKRMVSKYVIARGIDDYFENHWVGVSVDKSGGYIEPSVPWYRMGSGGDRLEVGEDSLSTITDGSVRTLRPTDEVLSERFAEVMKLRGGLIRNEDVQTVVNKINGIYRSRPDSDRLQRGIDFDYRAGQFEMTSGDDEIRVNYRTLYEVAMDLSRTAIDTSIDINTLTTTLGSYSAIQDLLSTKLTNGDTNVCYKHDPYNGGSLRIGDDVVHFVGSKDGLMIDNLISNLSKYEYSTDYDSAIKGSRNIVKLLGVGKEGDLLNKSADSIDKMLDFLA